MKFIQPLKRVTFIVPLRIHRCLSTQLIKNETDTTISSSLQTIKQANQQRFEQYLNQPIMDETGFKNIKFSSSFHYSVILLSFLWIVLISFEHYLVYYTDFTEDIRNYTKTELSYTHFQNDQNNIDQWRYRFFIFWCPLSRVYAHLGPLIHSYYIQYGDIDQLLYQFWDPFVAPGFRFHQIQILKLFTQRRPALLELYHRIQTIPINADINALKHNIIYTDYHYHPEKMTDLYSSLFDLPLHIHIPEYIQNSLCLGFWPILRLFVTPDNIQWGTYLDYMKYKASNNIKQLSFTDLHTRTNSLLLVITDIISACPIEEREVPLCFLKALVNTNEEFWNKSFRCNEYRAHLLKLLLQNKENSLKVFDSEALIYSKLQSDKSNNKTDRPRLVLEYLYSGACSIKQKKSFFEQLQLISSQADIQDICQAALCLINDAVAERSASHSLSGTWSLAIPTTSGRNSPPLDIVLKQRHLYVTMMIGITFNSVAVALCAPVRLPIRTLFRLYMRTALGSAMLENIYIIQEKLYNSESYYSDPSKMVIATAALIPFNSALIALSLKYFKWGFGAFLFNRVGIDATSDAYREF